MFNLLKLHYHKKNIYSYDQLHATLSLNPYVDVDPTISTIISSGRTSSTRHRLKASWRELTYSLYARQATALQASLQMLILLLRYWNKIKIKLSLERIVSFLLQRVVRQEDWIQLRDIARYREIANMEVNLEQLIPTPLRPIKQVELWKKWVPLIPEKYKPDTCPKPTDAIINSIKNR